MAWASRTPLIPECFFQWPRVAVRRRAALHVDQRKASLRSVQPSHTEIAGTSRIDDSNQRGGFWSSAPAASAHQGPREEIALAEVASQVLELGQLARRLHAFGDHVEPQTLASETIVRTISMFSPAARSGR